MKTEDPRKVQASQVFTPAAPIDKRALFAGRRELLGKIVDTVIQQGQHAIIFGERGVGKTSLANVIEEFLDDQVITAFISCDSGDNFQSLWRKVFEEIEIHQTTRPAGFNSHISHEATTIANELGGPMNPNLVRKVLASVTENSLAVIIIDEFDRVRAPRTQKIFADTIKTLSDHRVAATLVVVGVADTIDELLAEHLSVSRNLIQIHIPRMSQDELGEIINKGLSNLEMKIDKDAKDQIILISRGLPHYTHALSLHAVRAALDEKLSNIKMRHVETAVKKSLDDAQQSIKTAYHKAIDSPRKETLYSKVLLACALSKTDDMGFFVPPDLREPMELIVGKPCTIANYIQHLNAFCGHARGNMLQRAGTPRRYRYRFQNPLMQPFIMMQGFASGLLERSSLTIG